MAHHREGALSPPRSKNAADAYCGKTDFRRYLRAFVLAGTVLATCGNASASSGSNSAAQGERFTKSLLARARVRRERCL